MERKESEKLIQALYVVAEEYAAEARKACELRDTHKVYNAVKEERAALNKARKLELYGVI